MKYKKTILIDLDGVLNEYNGNYDKNIIPPIKNGVEKFLASFSQDEYELKIFTTRNLLLTAKWLIANKIDQYITDITNIKGSAYLIIDDRCICFNGDFKDATKQIKNFKAYWKP